MSSIGIIAEEYRGKRALSYTLVTTTAGYLTFRGNAPPLTPNAGTILPGTLQGSDGTPTGIISFTAMSSLHL